MTKVKPKEILKPLQDLFIPAQALEHPGNAEYATLADKLRAAALRLTLNGNFNDLITLTETTPYIFLKFFKFDPAKMGYNIIVSFR